MRRHARHLRILSAALAVVLAAGCSIGPQTMPRDRFSYSEALARSAREELLTNIVRFRYMESPTFMSVTSVVNQYSLESQLNGGAQWSWGGSAPLSSGGSLGAATRFADRPTITYAPMVGRHFTKSILTPMRPEAILTLVESGWKVDGLFPLTVHSVNGIRNRFHVGATQQALDPRFKQMVGIMADLQEGGTLSIRVIEPEDADAPTFALMISGARTDAEREKIIELKELLGLDPDAERYQVVFGSAARDATEIAIVTRSVLAILADMSSYVRVPEEHVVEGRASPGAPIDDGMRHPLAVHSGTEEPVNGYVKIRYRELWYWIDDRDLSSKRTFAVLRLLATLAESPEAAQTPLLTIPAG
jgi:hypothetical protein